MEKFRWIFLVISVLSIFSLFPCCEAFLNLRGAAAILCLEHLLISDIIQDFLVAVAAPVEPTLSRGVFILIKKGWITFAFYFLQLIFIIQLLL